jgi:serine/threonine protein kinase
MYFEDANYLYYVSGYYEGGNLQLTLDKKGRLTELEAHGIFQELRESVRYLQSVRVMHRDLKPQSILLTVDGHVKLANFQIMTQLKNKEERVLKTEGTPFYMSPEMIRGEPIGLDYDFYSIGVTLF